MAGGGSEGAMVPSWQEKGLAISPRQVTRNHKQLQVHTNCFLRNNNLADRAPFMGAKDDQLTTINLRHLTINQSINFYAYHYYVVRFV